MDYIKLKYHRFEDVDAGTIYMEAEIRADKAKKGAEEVAGSLDKITGSVNKTMSGLDKLKTSGGNFRGLQNSLKSLIEDSKSLDKLITSMSRQKTATIGFKGDIATLKSKESLGKTKIGFTEGTSTDSTQLLKETEFVYKSILDKTKLINTESSKRVSLANDVLKAAQKDVEAQEKAAAAQQKSDLKNQVALEKELAKAAKEAAKEAERKAKIEAQQVAQQQFQVSFTEIPGSSTATNVFREQYAELMKLIPVEQQEAIVKKLMSQENKKLVDSTVQQINALKLQAQASTKTQTAMDKLRAVMTNINNATEKSKKKFSEFSAHLQSVAVRWRILSSVAGSMINTFANLYQNAASYEESLNLYTVSMGEYAQDASKWVNKISDALYLDPSQIMQYTGALFNLVQGLGASSDAAYLMSTNLTQLAYDMSSYLNIDVEAAYTKLQSAITGQSRAVATAGIALQQASLQELAYTLGIDKKIAKMSQAEKTYLRYIQIMRSTTNMQGDLARTIITPENALRVIRQQFTLLGRAIGQVFIPIVLKAIPYIMVLVEALKKLANWLSRLTGYKIADIDYSGLKSLDMYSDSLDAVGDSATSAGDKIKNSLAPFDDLNVVSTETSGSGAGGGGVGGSVLPDLEEYLTGYDMLEGLTSQFEEQMNLAREQLEKMLPWVIAIGAAFVGWKLATGFMNGIIFLDDFLKAWGTVKELPIFASMGKVFGMLGSGISSVFGAIVTTFTVELPMAIGMLSEGISGILAGSLSIGDAWAIFIAPALTTILAVVGGIAAVIGGIVLFVDGIKKVLEGDTFKGVLKIVEGIALVVAGIALLAGGWVVALVAAVVAGVALVIEHWNSVKQFFIDLWNGICEGFSATWDAVVEFFTPVIEWFGECCAAIGQFFVDVWNGIVNVFSSVGNWFNQHVIQPIINIFTPIVAWFAALFSSIFNVLSSIVSNIIGLIKGCWEIITIVFGVAKDWFDKHVITPVGNFFSGLWNGIKEAASKAWDGIKSIFSTIGNWVNDNVIKPVGSFFSGLWDGFKNGASTAWNAIKSVFSGFASFFGDIMSAAWKKVKGAFTYGGEIFSGIVGSIKDVFCSIVNKLIDGINTVVAIPFKGINKALRSIKNIEILDHKPFENKISEINIPEIPHIGGYEKGGFPKSADLFFANENGKAEYIASIGNRTAVANQDQMVASLSTAIIAAMGNININNQPGITQVYIGNDKVYEGHGTYQNRQADRYGTTYVKV